MYSYSKIIVTGGTGWLGSRIAVALTEGLSQLGPLGSGGKRVKCLVRPDENADKLLRLGAEIHYGDILDENCCEELMKDCENSLVIHTAGLIHPKIFTKDFYKINVLGTMNLVHAAFNGQASRVVVVSSNSPLGCNPNPEHRFTEKSAYNPYMGYGLSKKLMEDELVNVKNLKEYPEITIVRPPWFYGPGQPPRQTEFFRMLKNGKFPLMGKGLNQRSMAFIDNLVLGVLLSGHVEKAAGQIYWIADETPYSMVDIANTVKVVLRDDFGFKVAENNLHVPAFISDLARYIDTGLQGMGLYHQKIHVLSEMNQTIACDISKAKKDLGYQPICELREGMRQSIEWCLQRGETL